MLIGEAMALPEPTDPDALYALFDGMTDELNVMKGHVRALMMNSAIISRGQCFEGAMRIVRAAAESSLTSESDRLAFALYAADLVETWMNEARPALEN